MEDIYDQSYAKLKDWTSLELVDDMFMNATKYRTIFDKRLLKKEIKILAKAMFLSVSPSRLSLITNEEFKLAYAKYMKIEGVKAGGFKSAFPELMTRLSMMDAIRNGRSHDTLYHNDFISQLSLDATFQEKCKNANKKHWSDIYIAMGLAEDLRKQKEARFGSFYDMTKGKDNYVMEGCDKAMTEELFIKEFNKMKAKYEELKKEDNNLGALKVDAGNGLAVMSKRLEEYLDFCKGIGHEGVDMKSQDMEDLRAQVEKSMEGLPELADSMEVVNLVDSQKRVISNILADLAKKDVKAEHKEKEMKLRKELDNLVKTKLVIKEEKVKSGSGSGSN